MNGIHDMGGMHGFGKVEVEANEPVFHTRWEARVFGMVQNTGAANIDAGRHALERLGPIDYLKNGYYGRWLAAMERTLIELGIVTADEIEARMRSPRPAERAVARSAETHSRPMPHPYTRQVATAPAFAVGQTILTRNHQPPGHTRLPAYARARRGTVVRIHPAMVFPDDNAKGRGENPQHLYTVCFDAVELWGDAAEPATRTYVDLFESYLQPETGHAPTRKDRTSKRKAAAAPRR